MKKEKINITNQRLVCRDDVEKINGLKLVNIYPSSLLKVTK